MKNILLYTPVFLRDSPTRFSTSIFIHHSNLLGPLINGLQTLFKFLLSYSNFSLEKIDSPGYDTQGSKKIVIQELKKSLNVALS